MKNPRRTAAYILICGIVSFCMRAFGLSILLTVLISIALCALVFVFALFYNGKYLTNEQMNEKKFLKLVNA